MVNSSTSVKILTLHLAKIRNFAKPQIKKYISYDSIPSDSSCSALTSSFGIYLHFTLFIANNRTRTIQDETWDEESFHRLVYGMVEKEHATCHNLHRSEFGCISWTSSQKIPTRHRYRLLHCLPRRAFYEASKADDFAPYHCIAYHR